jgi:hypothetical protein
MRWFRRSSGGADRAEAEALAEQVHRLLAEHGLHAFDRQLRLGSMVDDSTWQLDQDAAVLRLGSDTFPAQVIGSTASKSGTWLWGWANPSIDPRMKVKAEALRAIGEAGGPDVLVRPEVDANAAGGGHAFALAAVGLLDADAYYRCPHGGGEVFVLIDIPGVRDAVPDPEAHALEVLMTAAGAFPSMLSRPAVLRYLGGLGVPVHQASGSVTVGAEGGLSLAWDDLGRLTELSGTRS